LYALSIIDSWMSGRQTISFLKAPGNPTGYQRERETHAETFYRYWAHCGAARERSDEAIVLP